MNKEFVKKILSVQSKLKAPKGQTNKFGGYSYRSCEDILEAVKPLLAEEGLFLKISDSIIEKGSEGKERFYVEATVEITDGETTVESKAFARESEVKKGMDDSQITGSASSYARKYALNAMFLIDDTKDADATNDHGKKAPAAPPAPKKEAFKADNKNSFRKKNIVKKEDSDDI